MLNNKYFFGDKEVSYSDRVRMVGDVFKSVAAKYDLMNDLMSFGAHRLWKDEFVSQVSVVGSMKAVDVAGGTGDIAMRLRKKGISFVTVVDRNVKMMEEGRLRLIDNGELDVNWICGDAESLPLPDNSFDLYTISFGIRNVGDRNLALHEAYRVLRQGGIFACMEFSASVLDSDICQHIFDFYKDNIIPKLGEIFANDRESYKYLSDSIKQFPKAEDFAQEIASVGFAVCSVRKIKFGGAVIYMACKV
jgi:demethylmenaquinone methyltransferase/2-methoxy-6-polyprenyl-1,4-benzoquinol methylase